MKIKSYLSKRTEKEWSYVESKEIVVKLFDEDIAEMNIEVFDAYENVTDDIVNFINESNEEINAIHCSVEEEEDNSFYTTFTYNRDYYKEVKQLLKQVVLINKGIVKQLTKGGL